MPDSLNGLSAMSFPFAMLLTAAVYTALCLLSCFSRRLAGKETEKWERAAVPAAFASLALPSLHASFSLPYLCAVLLVGILLIVYAVYGLNTKPDEPYSAYAFAHAKTPAKAAVRLAGGFALLFFAFTGGWTVFRVLTFSSPTYDFGIFSQMFAQMKCTGLPITTLERDGLLSHFKVHISPIYYLMLPLYCLWPKPITLQLLQAAVMALAAIPMWKLAVKHNCTPSTSALFCLMLLLYPAYAGGASYDLHENAFLTPLLLWLFYAISCRSTSGCAVSCLLILMVKEDAAVYTAVAGLYQIFDALLCHGTDRRWKLKAGIFLFLGSVTWFAAATWYLASCGDGVMTYRYGNFIYDGSGSLLTVIKSCFLMPAKVLYECSDPEKLPFLALTMLPLCGLPLLTRKYWRFLLLIPYVLVNLMSDYTYQHSIFFQYTFGSTACLFYLALLNYADLASACPPLPPGAQRRLCPTMRRYAPLLLSAILCAVCFGKYIVPVAARYPVRYFTSQEHYLDISDVLKQIPQNASVTATSFYTVPLSGREILYDVRYASKEHLLGTEYVILDIHDKGSYSRYATAGQDGFTTLTSLLSENGFRLITEIRGIAIYHKEYAALRLTQ